MHRIVDDPRIAEYEPALGREEIRRAAEAVLDRARASGGSGDSILADVEAQLELLRLQELAPVINATGILLHTNLGRAPLAAEALAAVEQVSRGYSNLEYDLSGGERGSRYARVGAAFREATGGEDSLVVNNGAAAVLLVLDTLAKGREVVVGRDQLVEIGGAFRIPDVLERSGATLVEVGTTNRVYIEDYQRALSPRTALLLRTHRSNYRIDGFTHEVDGRELAELGRRAGVAVVEDLGGGALLDLAQYGAQHERTVREALADGIGLVTFSGDKLLGGPQAGIICGRAHLVARLRGNPLLRALRVDKMTLAALGATLRLHRDPTLRERLPLYRMLAATLDDLRARAEVYVKSIDGASVVDSEAYVGGGALPQARIASVAVAIATAQPDEFSARLRRRTPPIVGRIEDGRFMLDLRTIAPSEDVSVRRALTLE